MYPKVCRPKNNSDINGVIHSISGIKVTCDSTSPAEDNSKCTNAITINHNYHYCSKRDTCNAWLSFSIDKLFVYATHYSVQAPLDQAAPVSWKFYGRMNSNWVEIDRVEESGLTAKNYEVLTRRVSKRGQFNNFNISTEEKNYDGGNEFRIFKIDVFGIVSDHLLISSCKNRNYGMMYSFSFMHLIILGSY